MYMLKSFVSESESDSPTIRAGMIILLLQLRSDDLQLFLPSAKLPSATYRTTSSKGVGVLDLLQPVSVASITWVDKK